MSLRLAQTVIGQRVPIRCLASASGSNASSGKGSKTKDKNNATKKAKPVTESPKSVPKPPGPPPAASLPPNEPAGNEYKAKDMFNYNADSYADLMVDMEKYRLPRPSNKS